MTTPDLPDVVFVFHRSEWDNGIRQPARVYPDGAAFTMDDGKFTKVVRQWFVESDGLTSVERELAEREYVGNILARIHGDGGHYISDHGWKKAVDDADVIVCEMMRRRDQAEYELAEAKARIAAAVATCDALLEPRNTSISRAVSTAAKEIKRLLQPKGTA